MPKPLAADGTRNLIGKRLKVLRKEKRLSQKRLMEELQLRGFESERGVIKRIENGVRYVSDIELKILAEYFGVSYDYLIDGKE